MAIPYLLKKSCLRYERQERNPLPRFNLAKKASLVSEMIKLPAQEEEISGLVLDVPPVLRLLHLLISLTSHATLTLLAL